MDLTKILRTVRQRWAVIVACVLAAAVVTFLITPADNAQRVPYRATATLVQTPGGSVFTSSDPYFTQATLDSIKLFVTTGQIPGMVAQALGTPDEARSLAGQIAIATDPNSRSLTISSTSTDGARAATIANTFAEQTVSFFSEQSLQRRGAEIAALEEKLVAVTGALAEAEARAAAAPNDVVLQAERDAQISRYEETFSQLQELRAFASGSTEIAILQTAVPVPVASTGTFVVPAGRAARTAIAAAIGLLLGLALAFALERSDARVRTREDVLANLRVPVVADVPRMSRSERAGTTIAVVTQPLKSIAEAYRNARSAVLLVASKPVSPAGVVAPDGESRTGAGGPPKVILVTSGHAREGKTTTVANLAASLAETGRSVLVLDADFRAPNAHRYFDVAEGPGLSDHLTDPAGLPLDRLTRPTNVTGVRVVTAGTHLDEPAVLPSKMGPAVAAVRDMADVVVIDSAPMLHANDALDLLPVVDTVLLVARSGRLTASAGRRIAELLSRFNVPVVGAVLIGARGASHRMGYGYYGGAYYGAGRSSDGATKSRGRRARADEGASPVPGASG